MPIRGVMSLPLFTNIAEILLKSTTKWDFVQVDKNIVIEQITIR